MVSQEFLRAASRIYWPGFGYRFYGVASAVPYPWWWQFAILEWLARVKAVLDVEFLHPQQKFLGPAINITGDGRVTQE